MKCFISYALLAAIFAGAVVIVDTKDAAAASDQDLLKVATLELKENAVVYVPTHPNVTLFLQFPDVIADYTGRGFSDNPSEVAGDFYVRHLDGDSYLSVTPLTEDARRTLHVVCSGKGYPIHLFPAPEDAAWDKVIFSFADVGVAPGPQKAKARNASRKGASSASNNPGVERSSKAPSKKEKTLSSERALGMVDTLRMLSNLPERKARAMVASNSALSLSIKEKRQNCGDYSITTHFVLRDGIYDALGFYITIENATKDELVFAPPSFTVRAGEHVYTAATVDMDPVVKPRARAAAFVVVAGNGTGGENHLSVENDFRISLDAPARNNAAPVSTLEIPAPDEEGAHAR
jgi:hypothetical protein